MSRGRRGLFIVVIVTALVITPLVLGGVFLGYFVGAQVGYSGSIMAIAFSTVGFIAGMLIVLRIIRTVVAWSQEPRR